MAQLFGSGKIGLSLGLKCVHRIRMFCEYIADIFDLRENIPIFTRNSIAVIEDFEGLPKNAVAGEARLGGLRRVYNIVPYPNDFREWSTVGTASATTTNDISFPANSDAVYVNHDVHDLHVGDAWVFRVVLNGTVGETVRLFIGESAGGSVDSTIADITLTGSITSYSVSHTVTDYDNTRISCRILKTAATTATSVWANNAQLEDVTGQTNQNPSEFTLPQWPLNKLFFNGTNNYIECGTSTITQFSTIDFSVSFVMESISTSTHLSPLSKRGTGAPGTKAGWGIRINMGRVGIELDDGTANSRAGEVIGSTDLRDGIEHLVVVNFDRSGNAEIFIDGVSDGILDISLIGDIDGTEELFIGKVPSDVYYLNGYIKDINIYSRLLVGAETTAPPSTDASLVAQYAITEGEGNTIPDTTDNQNNGLLVNFDIQTKYYDYENGNTVDGNNVVTDTQGSAITTDKGYLVEEQRTNLIKESQDLDELVSWTKRGGLLITRHDAIAPDGTLSADKVYNIKNGAVGDLTQTLTSTQSSEQSPSFYIKRISTTGILEMVNPVNVNYGEWDIDLSALSDNWEYITKDHAAVTVVNAFNNTNSANYGMRFRTDDMTGISCHIWGCQFEDAAFPSSYIHTLLTTVTRASDILSYDLEVFPRSPHITMDVTPLVNGAKYTNNQCRLFGTDDSRGTGNEITTIGGAAYGYSANVFTIDKADLVADTTVTFEFILIQEGPNVKAIIKKDSVVEYSDSAAGTLDHSNTGIFQVGYWDGDYFSGHFQNVKVT